MRFARIKMMNFGSQWSEKTLAPIKPSDIRANAAEARVLLACANPYSTQLEATVDGSRRRFNAVVGTATGQAMLGFLKAYRWAENTINVIQREIDFLSNSTGHADPAIDTWLIIAPQMLAGEKATWAAGELELTVKFRSRVSEEGRFKTYSEPDHRLVAAYLCGVEQGDSRSKSTLALKKARQAALLLYPVRGEGETETSIGFAMLFPPNDIKVQLRWGVDSAVDGFEAEL
jgi:hypothetical protein